MTVIAEMLGFPPEDYERIKKWSDEMAEALTLNPKPEIAGPRVPRRQEIREYFNGIVARLKDNPGDNLDFRPAHRRSLRRARRALNPDELFSNCILLLAAGHETTTNLIGNGVLALLRNPDQIRDLREHTDELICGAVDELLRYDPPVQWMSRVTGETLTLGGQEIERGQILLASVAPSIVIPPSSPIPTGSTSGGRTTVTCPSAPAVTSASARHGTYGSGSRDRHAGHAVSEDATGDAETAMAKRADVPRTARTAAANPLTLRNDDLRTRLHVVGVEAGIGVENALVLRPVPVDLFRDVPEIVPGLDRVATPRRQRQVRASVRPVRLSAASVGASALPSPSSLAQAGFAFCATAC